MSRPKNSVLRYILSADPVGQAKLFAHVTLGVFLGLAPLHLFRLILDQAIPRHSTSLLWTFGGILLGFTLLRVVVDYRQALVADRLRNTVIGKLREQLLAHVLRLGPDFFAKSSVGQITTRIQLEVGRLGMSVASIFVDPIVESTTFVVYAAYLVSMSPSLSLMAVSLLPVVLVAAPRISRRLTDVSKRFGARTGEFSASLQETLSAAFEVQVHGTYAYEQARVGHRQDRQADLWHEITRQGARLSLVAQLVRGIGPIIVYMYGALLAMRGDMAVGQIVAFASVLGGLYASLEKLIKVPPLWQSAQDRFDELGEYLDLPKTFVDGAGARPKAMAGAAVALRDVTFAYDRPILDGVSLDVAPGERVAFVGRSGCGKSTALNLVCGRLRAKSGEVTIDGTPIDDFTVAELTGSVGVVGQTPIVFSGTVRDNLVYALLRGDSGQPGSPLSYLERDLPDLDRQLLAACARVAFDDDLFDLGLEMRVPPAAAQTLLAARATLPADPSIVRFTAGKYIQSADVAENLLFAPDDDGMASGEELRIWSAAAERAGIAPMVARLGDDIVRRDLDYLQSVAADSPDLLKSLGTDADDVARRVRLAEQCRSRPIERAALGDAVFDELVRRGLVGRDVPAADHDTIVAAREPMRRALGSDAPPAYDPELWHERLSIRDNLLFGRIDPRDRSAHKRVRATLRAMLDPAIVDVIRAHALRFDVGERGSRLSGGQRQKVSLARVLLKKPRLLLLDEVTAALDQGSARHVFDLFAAPDPSCTVIAITHQLSWLDRFDRVVVFEAGRVAGQGTRAELAAQTGLFRELEQAGHHP